MKRLLCLVALACLFMLSTTSGVFALNHPYQWEKPSTDNESHPWGGEDNASSGGPLKSNTGYREYTGNWTLDLLINSIVEDWSGSYRFNRSFITPNDQTETTQPSTINSTNRGN